MLKKGKELVCLDAELAPYAFQDANTQGTALNNCFGGWLNGLPFIRSSVVDTGTKLRSLISLAEKLHREQELAEGSRLPFRIVCDQLQSPEFEWTSIFNEHQSIISVSENDHVSIHHICSPIGPIAANAEPPFKPQSVINLLDQMSKTLNMESWADFCSWFAFLLDDAFDMFSYDSVDGYALERHIQEFLREAGSSYLKHARQHLLVHQLELGHPEAPTRLGLDKRILKEKEVIEERHELQKLIFDHYRSIVEIAKIIPLILDAHPELERIERASIYLRELIGVEVNDKKARSVGWGLGQMIKQLLCDELKVIPAIHCDTGLLRTHFAFAVRSAIITLKKQITSKELIDLVVNWEEKAVLLNRMAARQGKLADHPSARHAAALRDLVFQYLKNVCVPISEMFPINGAKQIRGEESINLEPFNYIPSFYEGNAFVEYDPVSGAPAKLTAAGLRFLEKLQ